MGQLLGLGAAATTAGTAATTTALGTGLKMGATIGGLTAPAGFTLAPTIGATLPTAGSLLTAGGGGLGGLGGAGGLLGGSGALLPKFASLGGAGGSLLGGGGLGGALTPTGLASLQMPAGSLLQGGASQLANASNLANTVTPNLVGRSDVLNAFQQAQLNPFKGAELGKVADASKYLTEGAGPSVSSIEARQFADLASGVKTPGSLRMPSGVEGLRAPPITPETSVAQGPLAFRQALPSGIDPKSNFLSNFGNLISNPSMQGVKDYAEQHPIPTSVAAGLAAKSLLGGKPKTPPEQDKGMIRPYEYTRTQRPEAYAVSPLEDTSERIYFDSRFTPLEPYAATSEKAKEIEKIAAGGIAKAYAIGGPVETMAAMNAVGANTGYPMAGINTPMYSNPMVQRPEAVNVLSPSGDAGVGAYSGEPKFARGGLSDLGDYSDGGRLLKGPGDGVSDSIPAVIGKRQPARLADGEFVIPARIVSELGNGSTEAGARKLYAMMDRIQKGRRKSVGKGKVAVDSKSDKHLPA